MLNMHVIPECIDNGFLVAQDNAVLIMCVNVNLRSNP